MAVGKSQHPHLGGTIAAEPAAPSKNLHGEHAVHFLVQVLSLVPDAPSDKAVFDATIGLGETLNLASRLNLPVGVRITRDKLRSTAVDEFYQIEVVDQNGGSLASMYIGDNTTATFVKQRVQVDVSAEA